MSMPKTEQQQGYDLIGDVHGCALSLERLLRKMDYDYVRGCFRHPSRKVIFVGDIVDRGPRIREALHIVKDMVDQGQAEIVLGNHEIYSLCYCTPARPESGLAFLREHTARHHRLIRETLEQFEAFKSEWQDFLKWFHTIPLAIEKEHFRVVHACWDVELIQRFRQLSPSLCLDENLLHDAAVPGTFVFRVVDRLTRGTSLFLPDNETILGQDGFSRNMFRTKFWTERPQKYGDVVFQPDPLPEVVSERHLSVLEKQSLLQYGASELPVFVGHYWMEGEPEPIQPNIACLDYSAVKYGKLVAYRMDDERILDKRKFVWVDVTRP